MNDLQNESIAIFNKTKSQFTAQNFVRYLVEGAAVAIAAYVIPNRRTKFNEIAIIAIVAALSLFVLDIFSTDVGSGSRLGAGFGIGYNLVSTAPTALPFMML